MHLSFMHQYAVVSVYCVTQAKISSTLGLGDWIDTAKI